MKKSILVIATCILVIASSFSIFAEDSILLFQTMITNQTNNNELFDKPYNLTISNDGYLFLVDQKYTLQKFNVDGTKVNWTAHIPTSNSPIQFASVAVTEDGKIYFAHKTDGVYALFPDGQLENHIKFEEFSWLDSITYHAQDQLIYLADNSTIHILSKSGELEDTFENPNLWQPCGIVLSPRGNLYVADTNHQEIKVFNPWGELLLNFGSPTTTQGVGQLDVPFGIAIDQNNRVYVSNFSRKAAATNSINIYSEDGRFLYHYPLTLHVTRVPIIPTGIAIMDNQLFVTDIANNALLIFQITDINTHTSAE